MIHINNIRRKAEQALPNTAYQNSADSPTVRGYTDWSVFEGVLPADRYSRGEVVGVRSTAAIPSFDFAPSSHRALAHHFSRLPSFFAWDGSPHVVSKSTSGHTAHHFFLPVSCGSELFLEDIALKSSKTLTIDVFVEDGGSLHLLHLLNGTYPQYTHVRIHLGAGSSFSGHLAVIGSNAHINYEAFLYGKQASFSLSGLSITGRSDVVTDAILRSENGTVNVKHLLLSSPRDFLAHRGVVRVEPSSSGALVDMDSSFITSGGFVAVVPQLEILTDNVRAASHRARDIGLDDERVFYMRSRGLSGEDVFRTYVEHLARELLGELSSNEKASEYIRSFSGSL